MQALTAHAESSIQSLAHRYGVSLDAVRTLLFAVSSGGGTMAQFYHPDLGGGGQWMRGGMTMVGDMFNHGLVSLVNGLCSELSQLLANDQVFLPAPPQQGSSAGHSSSNSSWWPSSLGSPSSVGGQNDTRYAYFPQAHRLALDLGGRIELYDTLDHQIGGVQQQQGGGSRSLSFSSQWGTFTVDSLPRVDEDGNQAPPFIPEAEQTQQYADSPVNAPASSSGNDSHDQILASLERLGALRDKGILTEQEFQAKKADLLARL